MKNNEKLVLITGGAGFIGSHLVKQLVKYGYRVRVLDALSVQVHGQVPGPLSWLENDSIEFIRGNVCDKASLESALQGVDSIVHLAAETGTGQSMYEIHKYYEVNVQATAMLFDILANQKKEFRTVRRVVLASSRSVYGEGAYVCVNCDSLRQTPAPRSSQLLRQGAWEPVCIKCEGQLKVSATNENDDVSPASLYAATKYAQEDIVRISCSAMGVGFSILRLQNVYGEGQSLNNPYTGILSIFSTRIRRGLITPIFEDGEETRDFVHVSDVVEVMRLCLEVKKSPDQVINVGSGVATSVFDIASYLHRHLGKESNIKVTGEYRLGDIRHNIADITKLNDLLNYAPKIDIVSGLKLFSEWVVIQPIPKDKLEASFDELKARKLMG